MQNQEKVQYMEKPFTFSDFCRLHLARDIDQPTSGYMIGAETRSMSRV